MSTFKGSSVAIGIFDGVHLGHRRILGRMLAEAARHGLWPTVVTFDPHPAQVLHPPSRPPVLMSLAHRLRLFAALGVKKTVVIRFTKKFSQVPRERFLEDFLIKKLRMRSLTIGHDFCFGYKGRGTARYLRARGRELGFRLSQVSAVRQRGRIISSTSIRRLILRGQLEAAGRMLGRPVSIYGDVVRGKGRGRRLGFPTTNLNPHHETIPPSGVYAIKGGGVVHIGPRPTFGEKDPSIEAHFPGFKGSLYGREVELEFVRRLRGIRKFRNKKQLIEAIQNDIITSSQIEEGE
ncbi:MAG: riboflavin biosynthesis protein RibF [Omnitrophica bacterium RIFCSPHIGHO2_02_FULL_63_14]|nr:MAG: riboflavin biosynthesis protein RibF [Omnitrophica bacterium RIFCSPHIGHO2_02_FULL_63_14]